MEEELLRLYQAKTRRVQKKVVQLIQGLSYSGQTRYRASLQKVASEAKTGSIKKHAVKALPRLEQYTRWNAIILAGFEDAPEGSLNELRIRNMIGSGDQQLRRIGAREANRYFLGNERVVAAANQSMLHEFNRSLDQPDQVDSILWLMEVVVNSGNPDYVSSFTDIAANANRNASSPSMAEPAAMVPAEKRSHHRSRSPARCRGNTRRSPRSAATRPDSFGGRQCPRIYSEKTLPTSR